MVLSVDEIFDVPRFVGIILVFSAIDPAVRRERIKINSLITFFRRNTFLINI